VKTIRWVELEVVGFPGTWLADVLMGATVPGPAIPASGELTAPLSAGVCTGGTVPSSAEGSLVEPGSS
jgi:hypothetical protein